MQDFSFDRFVERLEGLGQELHGLVGFAGLNQFFDVADNLARGFFALEVLRPFSFGLPQRLFG